MLLPPEILAFILSANLNTKTLLRLLRVSRLFKSVAEPLLFNDVVFPRENPRQTRSRVEAFRKRVISDDGRLALRVHAVSAVELDHIQTVLPLLHNLRRLKLRLAIEPQVLSASLSPSTKLTHFKCHSYLQVSVMPPFVAFLESQPALEYLHFDCGHEIVLSEDALPMLHTLIAATMPAFSILPGRNVQHLELFLMGNTELPPANPAFEKVITLSCAGLEYKKFVQVAVCFPNVKYLEFSCDHAGPAALNVLENLRSLSMMKIKYLSIVVRKQTPESAHIMGVDALTPPFKKLPTLRILAVEWFESSRSDFFRYRVDDEVGARRPVRDRDWRNSSPPLLERRKLEGWPSWWEGKLDSVHW